MTILKYIEREADESLRAALIKHHCVGVFEPSRRGKTRLVENLQNHGYEYCVIVNGPLGMAIKEVREVVEKFETTHRGTPPQLGFSTLLVETRIIVENMYQRLLATLPSKGDSAFVVHVDELQDYFETRANFGRLKDNPRFQDPVYHDTVSLMCIIHHFEKCTQTYPKGKLVFSGVSIRGAEAINILSSTKYVPINIAALNRTFISNVLMANGVSFVENDLDFFIGGDVGQLCSVVATKKADDSIDEDAAFKHWSSAILTRRKLSWDDVLQILVLITMGSATDSTITWKENADIFPFLNLSAIGHSSWLRIVREVPLEIESPSTWHNTVFKQLLSSRSSLIMDAFYSTNSASTNDPDKGIGHVFQLLFAIELLERRDSPLFAQLGATPTTFTRHIRFKTYLDWENRTLYIVQESSVAKCGDIVFIDGDGKLFVLEFRQRELPEGRNESIL